MKYQSASWLISPTGLKVHADADVECEELLYEGKQLRIACILRNREWLSRGGTFDSLNSNRVEFLPGTDGRDYRLTDVFGNVVKEVLAVDSIDTSA
ncbi:MAG: hypothetical protein WKF77_08950 [Planctomycetaceae bacterium]